jgi:hypothetical protein
VCISGGRRASYLGMENLCRLMLVRPAVAQDPENSSIDLTQDSPYQSALRRAVKDGRGRKGAEAMRAGDVRSRR